MIKYRNVDVYQQEHLVLKNVNLDVNAGEFIYLLGKVGSGKSSLLKSFYQEVMVDTGEAMVLDYDLPSLKNKEVPYLRRKIGIVFQDFQLLTDRTVQDNLEFVLRATGWKDKSSINDQIDNVLMQVGMSNKGYKRPHELSGGEQQRIVIARALLNSPEIILADEPTGNLDPVTGNELVDLLYKISISGTTVIMATHNLAWLDAYPGRIIRCVNEGIAEESGRLPLVDEKELELEQVAETVQVSEEQNEVAVEDPVVEESPLVDAVAEKAETTKPIEQTLQFDTSNDLLIDDLLGEKPKN